MVAGAGLSRAYMNMSVIMWSTNKENRRRKRYLLGPRFDQQSELAVKTYDLLHLSYPIYHNLALPQHKPLSPIEGSERKRVEHQHL